MPFWGRESPGRFATSFPGSTFAVPFPDTWTTVLDGDGGYKGLIAVLRTTNLDEGSQTCRGFIIDAGLLPPTPENTSFE